MTATATEPEPETITPEQTMAAHIRKRMRRLSREQRHANVWTPRRIRRLIRLDAAASALENR
jgi:hypothetical protein